MSPATSKTDLDRLALDNLATAVLILDGDFAIIYTNPAAEGLLGVGANQLYGKPFSPFLTSDCTERELRQVQISESSHTHRAAKLRTHSDGIVTVDITTSAIGQGRLLLELQSVDRILQINREDTLLSVQTASQELVRGLAHEVKNPLGGIKGSAQLLASELTVEQREYTDLIISESNRLSQLVDQLLGPSRPLQLAETNIHQITEHVAALITAESQSDETTLTIHRDYDPSIPELQADSQQLIQATLNIGRNAMQALSAQANGEIILRTRIQRHFTIGKTAHRVVLRLDIEDNGPGIAEDIAERIFYPMISGRRQGSGLGLHIAQTIVNRHSGLIECSSQPGETRFSIFLPLKPTREQSTDE